MTGEAAAARRRLAGVFDARRLERFGIAFDPRAISPAEGVRGALAVAPFLIIKLFDPSGLWSLAALSAFLTCLCDSGGPVNERVRPTLTYAIAGALLFALMGMLRAAGPVPTVLVGGLVLFACALMRVYGQVGQTLGNLLGVVAVLALDEPLPPMVALEVGALFLGGGLWASALTLGLWRLHPHMPARRALAQCYRSLAQLVGDLATLLAAPTDDPDAWAAHFRRHRRAVRERIEIARANLLGAVRWLGPSSTRATQGLIRLEVAEQVFGRLIALSDMLEQGSEPPCRLAALRVLRRLRLMLRILSRAIITDRMTPLRLVDQVLHGMDDQAHTLPPGDPVRAALDDITERMRVAVNLSTPSNLQPGIGPDGSRPPLAGRLWTPLRANLNRQSLAMRHALRVTVLTVPALALTVIWYNDYEHWLTITLLVTLQPYYAQTFTRALERVGGTVLGGLVAAAIGLVFVTPLSMTIAMIVFLLGALSIRYVGYGVFIAVLTPMIVLLSENSVPGRSELVVAAMRGMFTILGGAIALAGVFLLWPSWEPARLAEELRRAIAAHGAYADTVLARLLGEPDAPDLDTVRRAAGLASNNVEASLSRALLEPARLDRRRLESAMLVDAALRRMAGRLTVLALGEARAMPAATLRAWRGWIAESVAALTAGTPGRPPPRPKLDPTLPAADSLVRLARQLELMAEVI
jgi:uncharacterized membrane protein YccC